MRQNVVNAMIRNIRKDDYFDVNRILLQLHKVHVNGRPELFIDKDCAILQDNFNSVVDNDEIISILEERNHQVVGVCFVSMMETSGMVRMKTAYINEIAVDEPYRRKGIGRKLFREAEKRSRKMGAKRIDLLVWGFNENAIAAYESYGMTPQRFFMEKGL